ncbi:MAG: NifU family protein [Promethearchaeota archaeon]
MARNFTKEEIEKIIDKIRPSLLADGGDVELVDVNGNRVFLRLLGHCRGCAYSQMTLRMGIEQILKQELDSSIEVIGVD